MFASIPIIEKLFLASGLVQGAKLFESATKNYILVESVCRSIYSMLLTINDQNLEKVQLYPDEVLIIEEVINYPLSYFESVEEYEKCTELIRIKGILAKYISIIS